MHSDGLLKILCKHAEDEVQQLYTCNNLLCLARLHGCVKLFMKTRIYHALKVSYIGKTYSLKRSRKMLKLCHE